MDESGINSFAEFALYYLFAGMGIGALWVILEADVVLGPVSQFAARRARRVRVARLLAPLGLVHIAFAVAALDATRDEDGESFVDDGDERRRLRARKEALAYLAVGALVLALVSAPHVPLLREIGGVEALTRSIPWEST